MAIEASIFCHLLLDIWPFIQCVFLFCFFLPLIIVVFFFIFIFVAPRAKHALRLDLLNN